MIEVQQLSTTDVPRLSVNINCDYESPQLRKTATVALERLLGIRVDLREFYQFAARKPSLRPLVQRYRGMKPPRYLTVFECLANAISCQQISLAAGIHLLNRFATQFGMPFGRGKTRHYAFPRPQDLSHADKRKLVRIGFSRQKAGALLNLAQAIRENDFHPEALASMSDDDCIRQLCRRPGIGRWSAEYLLLRGLGRLHVFPADDVGARNSLKHWLRISHDIDYAAIARILNRWQPFAGIIYFYLLLDKLAAAGHVNPQPRS